MFFIISYTPWFFLEIMVIIKIESHPYFLTDLTREKKIKIQVISGINSKEMEKKSPDGAAVQKYQKQILKQWYLHYWHTPKGARGVKKSGRPNWRPLWWIEALRFSPNRIKFKKSSQFLQFWLNLSAPTHQSGFQFGRTDFLTPMAHLGACQ